MLYNYTDTILEFSFPFTLFYNNCPFEHKFEIRLMGCQQPKYYIEYVNIENKTRDFFFEKIFKEKNFLSEFIEQRDITTRNNKIKLFKKDKQNEYVRKISIIIDNNNLKKIENFKIIICGEVMYDLPAKYTFKKKIYLNGIADNTQSELHEIEFDPFIVLNSESENLIQYLEYDMRITLKGMFFQGIYNYS